MKSKHPKILPVNQGLNTRIQFICGRWITLFVLLIAMVAVTPNQAQCQTRSPEDRIIWQPPPRTTWQWQLSGTINTSYDVEMYDIDLFETPQSTIDELQAAGRIVIAYFSAGSFEDWRPDAPDFPPEVLGNDVDGWPGERWLDIRRFDILGPIMEARLDLAVAKGFDGVEPDLVDGYANDSGFPLTAGDQLAYNSWIANRAHERGLSVGLKNDVDQVAELLPYFDWALNEECFFYDECDLLFPFINAGKAVFGVEYVGDRDIYCPLAVEYGFSWLTKTLDLGDELPASCDTYASSVGDFEGDRIFSRAFPNPFMNSVKMTFYSPLAERGLVTIYNPSGRSVSVLETRSGSMDGEHSVIWNGRDMAGNPVAPGIYFARWDGGGFPKPLRILRLR